MIIKTQFVHPPISLRDFDWMAVDEEGRQSAHHPIGYGRTEQEAVVDLVEQLIDRGELTSSDC